MWVTLRRQQRDRVILRPFSDRDKFCWSQHDNKCLSVREVDPEVGPGASVEVSVPLVRVQAEEDLWLLLYPRQ